MHSGIAVFLDIMFIEPVIYFNEISIEHAGAAGGDAVAVHTYRTAGIFNTDASG